MTKDLWEVVPIDVDPKEESFLLEIGFHEWKKGSMRAEFVKKNTPQDTVTSSEQKMLLNRYNLRKHAGKW